MFRLLTTVSLVDHDIMVPYATSAITSFSPWLKDLYGKGYRVTVYDVCTYINILYVVFTIYVIVVNRLGWELMAFSGFESMHVDFGFSKICSLSPEGPNMKSDLIGKEVPQYISPSNVKLHSDIHQEVFIHAMTY